LLTFIILSFILTFIPSEDISSDHGAFDPDLLSTQQIFIRIQPKKMANLNKTLGKFKNEKELYDVTTDKP
jgi:hypothetical protein